MSIDLSSILGTSGTATSSIDRLVSMYMAVERQPVQALKAKRDQLDLRTAVFNDLKTKINDLKSAADALSTSTASVFGSHTVTSSDSTLATASASSSAANGVYVLDSMVLAKAHRVQSAEQLSSWTAGGAGSLVVNGTLISVANGATLSELRTAINSASYATGKGVVATIVTVDSTHSRLVLDAQGTGTTNTLKLADVTGSTLSSLGIATTTTGPAIAGVTATVSSADPAFPAANLTDGVTGDAGSWHGDPAATSWTVTMNLGSSQSVSRLEWGRDQGGAATSGTPKDYTLEYSNDGGTTWTALKTVTGNSVTAGGVKEDTFFPVTANMMRMTITATSDATAPAIDEMKLYNDQSTLALGAELQAAQNASLTVNGVAISGQSSNTISSAVSGLTLQLNKAGGPVTLTVAGDTSAMNTKITAFLDKLNALTDYLSLKSAVTKGVDGNYTRGLLNGYSTYTRLESDLASDLATTVSGLPAGAPTRLSELGIKMDSSLHFVVSDSSKLSSWLSTNASGVAAFFGGDSGVAKLVFNRISPYVTAPAVGSTAYLDREIAAISSQQSSIDAQTKTLNGRLAIKEKSLTDQFTRLQALMIQATQQQQQIQSLFASYY